jgi:beta-glucosidase
VTSRAFPQGFRWGTATAAHQVEGGNWNNDWWAWERDPDSGCREPSGDAIDHYHRFDEDIRLLAQLGFTSYRFSVEWSRIEPEEGQFSVAALDHYRRMVASCRAHGLEAVVTLHHFTSPRWLATEGGWADPGTAARFVRFADRTTAHLGDLVSRLATFNEPNIVATMGHLVGIFPPGHRDVAERRRVNDVFIDAHHRAVPVIKAHVGDVPVGLTLAMSDYQAVADPDGGRLDEAEARVAKIRRNMEDVYLEAGRDDDFLGVQTYSRSRIGADGTLGPEEGARVLVMGYEFYPDALAATIRRAWEVTEQTPLVVTENGIGTDDDTERQEYLGRALEGVLDCLDEGIDVGGYFCWSAFDNFEWALGYLPRFGIIDVDRDTQERIPKPSARWLGGVARDNALG